jgi:hypothetical protein
MKNDFLNSVIGKPIGLTPGDLAATFCAKADGFKPTSPALTVDLTNNSYTP